MDKGITPAMFPYVVTATVVSVRNVGRQIGINIEGNVDNLLGTSVNVLVVGEMPTVKQRGLVLFPAANKPDENGYWLGPVNDRFVDRNDDNETIEVNLPEGAKGLFDNRGETGFVATNNAAVINTPGLKGIFSSDFFKVSKAGSFMHFDNGSFNINLSDSVRLKSKFVVDTTGVDMLSGGEIRFKANNNIDMRTPGNFIISGNKTREGTDKPIDLFRVKCARASIAAGGGFFNVSAGSASFKIGSAELSMSGGTPGDGPENSYEVEVLHGKMDFSTGLGDISMRCIDPTKQINLTQGLSSSGLVSTLNLDKSEAVLEAKALLVKSKLTLKRSGSAILEADTDIDLKTTTGNITLDSNGDVNVNAIKDITLDSKLGITIGTLVNIVVNALKLDLSGASIIDTGPKVVTPGPGPLCSLPVCAITGAVHSGSIAIG